MLVSMLLVQAMMKYQKVIIILNHLVQVQVGLAGSQRSIFHNIKMNGGGAAFADTCCHCTIEDEVVNSQTLSCL